MSEIRPELHLWVAYLEKKEQLEEAQDRIEELEAVLLVLETEIVKLDLDYLNFLRVGRIINAALEGGKQ